MTQGRLEGSSLQSILIFSKRIYSLVTIFSPILNMLKKSPNILRKQITGKPGRMNTMNRDAHSVPPECCQPLALSTNIWKERDKMDSLFKCQELLEASDVWVAAYLRWEHVHRHRPHGFLWASDHLHSLCFGKEAMIWQIQSRVWGFLVHCKETRASKATHPVKMPIADLDNWSVSPRTYMIGENQHSASFPLTSTCIPWLTCTHAHTHIHM